MDKVKARFVHAYEKRYLTMIVKSAITLTDLSSLSSVEAGSGPKPVILGSNRKSSKIFLAASFL